MRDIVATPLAFVAGYPIFLTKSSVRTVPVGVIAELIRGDVFYWGQLMAGALLGSVPVALIYSFFVEHYVAGLTSGSVKG
jgi:multiple sugar transport system permease protein